MPRRCEYVINKNNNSDVALTKGPKNKGRDYLLLSGFALDQTADKSAAIGLLLHLIGGDNWSRITRTTVQFSMALFGGVASIAEVQTAKENLKMLLPPKQNRSLNC